MSKIEYRTTNDVVRTFSKKQKKAKLLVKKLDRDSVLIEGTATAFQFLGEFLLAHSGEADCGRYISPKGPGNAWFTKGSTLGFYFHKLPCAENKFPRKKRK